MNRIIKGSTSAIGLVVFSALFYSGLADAANLKISDFATGWKDEIKIIVPIFLLLFAALGIFFAAWGIISAITTKKQNQPLSWQLFSIVGGALAVVVPVIVLATAGSVTSNNGNASSTLSELGVDN